MKYWAILLLLVLTFFSPKLTYAQSIESQMSSINVDNLSDQQIISYWNKAQEQGYTLNQLEVLAKAKGMSAIQVSKLKRRITTLKYANPSNKGKNTEYKEDIGISDLEKFGLQGTLPREAKKDSLFGYDFFKIGRAHV